MSLLHMNTTTISSVRMSMFIYSSKITVDATSFVRKEFLHFFECQRFHIMPPDKKYSVSAKMDNI